MGKTWAQIKDNETAKGAVAFNIANNTNLLDLLNPTQILTINKNKEKPIYKNLLEDNGLSISKLCEAMIDNIYFFNKDYFDLYETVITVDDLSLYIKAILARAVLLNKLAAKNLVSFTIDNYSKQPSEKYYVKAVDMQNVIDLITPAYWTTTSDSLNIDLDISAVGCIYKIKAYVVDLWKLDLTGQQDISLIEKNLANFKIRYTIKYLRNIGQASYTVVNNVADEVCIIKDFVKDIKDKISTHINFIIN